MSRVTTWLLGFIMMGLLTVPLAHAQIPLGSLATGTHGSFPPTPLPTGTTTITIDLTGRATGVPGQLTFTNSTGTSIGTATMANAPSGFPDGILQVTTFNLGSGVTLKFVPNHANTPITILAQGDVSIAGVIDVSGAAGDPGGLGGASGGMKGGLGGPGGFKGGTGETTVNSVGGAGDGLGPGSGAGGGKRGALRSTSQAGGSGGGFGTGGATDGSGQAAGGGIYGTPELLPLVGGSGGGGGCSQSSSGGTGGGGGGGGGGAILIASSGTLSINGLATTSVIIANGGAGGNANGGGGGAGGAIRLVANTLRGNAALTTAGGAGGSGSPNCFNGGNGGNGRIRLEAFNFDATLTGNRTGNVSQSGPGPVLFTNAPTISITRVVGATPDPVPSPPLGGFGAADVSVTAPGPVMIVLQTTRVPVGSGVCVTAKPEAQSQLPVTTSPCPTVAADGSVTATLTLGAGGKYFIEARANFTIQ